MIRQIVKLPVRSDAAGDGRFGAKRGDRAHKGVDYVCTPGAPVLSPVDGTAEVPGIAYGDDHSFKIVNIRGRDGRRYRLFYCRPLVHPGERVTAGMPVGIAQNVAQRYLGSDMQPHVHYQIEGETGEIINPETLHGENT